MEKPTTILTPDMTQNNEPYVFPLWGPLVTADQQERATQVICAHGYGARQGYGPGRRADAVAAARTIARKLRRLGWSVSIAD